MKIIKRFFKYIDKDVEISVNQRMLSYQNMMAKSKQSEIVKYKGIMAAIIFTSGKYSVVDACEIAGKMCEALKYIELLTEGSHENQM